MAKTEGKIGNFKIAIGEDADDIWIDWDGWQVHLIKGENGERHVDAWRKYDSEADRPWQTVLLKDSDLTDTIE